jgi:hypothetical protein
MKYNIFIIIFLFFNTLASFSQEWTLPFSSRVEKNGKKLQGATVTLMQGSKQISQTMTGDDGSFKIQIPANGDYIAIVTKPGHCAKRFQFSTRGVPAEKTQDNFKGFNIESISLFEPLPNIDYSVLNQSLVKVNYDPAKDNFDYDEAYINQMLSALARLKQLEQDAINKQKELEANYTASVKAGDAAFKKKDWVMARAGYNQALTYKPAELYPKDQLAQIEIIIKDQEALNKKAADDAAKKAAEKAAADAAAKAKAEADAKAKADAEAAAKKKAEEEAARLAKEKADKEAAAKAAADKLAAEKAAADAAAKAKAEADAKAKADAEAAAKKKAEEEAARLAKEKADKEAADAAAKAKAEADKLAKELANKSAAEKAAAEAKAKADAEAARLAKEKADKEAADAAAKAKAEADKLAKELANKSAAEKAAAEAKAKADAEAARIAKEKADKEAADAAAKAKAEADKLAKELENKSAAEKAAAEAKAKADAEAARLAKEKADKEAADAAAKAKAEADKLAKELENKSAAEKAAAEAKAKADAEAARLAKEKADKEAADAAAKAKAEADKLAKENKKPTVDKYKEAITKADGFFNFKKYNDAKKSYEEALIAKAGDSYAKGRLAEIEKLLKSDVATAADVDAKQKALMSKYPPGVTEETIVGTGVVIIQRVVVKETEAYVYQKKIFSWGGISYFRDTKAITESTFEQETKP